MIKKLISVSLVVLMIMSLHVTYTPGTATAISVPQKILIVVEDAIYDPLSVALNQYVSDIEAEGYTTFTYRFASGTAATLKNTITSYYNNQGISGALFIGDLPIAYYEIANDFPSYSGGYGYAKFPIDLYYMDLNGTWGDSDHDGIYDGHSNGSGNRDPEIWVGRLLTSRINNSGYDEVGLLLNYFAKNHSYRTGGYHTGGLSVNHRALTFHDDDWSYWGEVSLNNVYPTVGVINSPTATSANNYKAKLRNNYEWIHVSVHSTYTGHYFYVNGSSNVVGTDNIQTIDPKTLFYNLFACSNCRYTKTNYMGGRYVFTETYGLVAVGSTKTGSMLNFSHFYNGLGSPTRNNLGHAYRDWFRAMIPDGSVDWRSWFYGMTLLGDPTLSISPPIATINSISPVDSVQGESVTFDGTGSISNGSITAYSWRSNVDGFLDDRATFSTTTLSGGEHTIYFQVQDSTGRWSTEQTTTITVEDDPNIPLVVITNPVSGSQPSYEGFTFSGTATAAIGIDSVWVSVYDYGRATTTVSNQQAQFNDQTGVWSFAVQPHHITAGARVKLMARGENIAGDFGGWREQIPTVETDAVAPTVTMAAPTPNSSVSHEGFTFHGTAADTSGIEEVRVYVEHYPNQGYTVSNKLATYDSNTNTWSYSVQPYHVRPGKQTRLWVRAKDKVGNYGAWLEMVVNVDADTIKPVVTMNTPTPNTTVSNGGFTFSGTATDACGVAEVRVYVEDYGRNNAYTVNNLRASYNGQTHAWSFNVFPTHVTPGAQARLWVRAIDKNNNRSPWLDMTVTIEELETQAPTMTITSPSANQQVSNAGFSFTGTAQDASGIAEVRIYVEDYGRNNAYTVNNLRASYNGTTKVWSFNVFPTHLTPGSQARLWARATDKAGNHCNWQSIIVNVAPLEQVPPQVTILEPTANSTVSNTGFRFKGDAFDAAGIRGVWVYVEDLSRNTYTVSNAPANFNASTGRWRFDVLTRHVTAGAQARLWVRAKDKTGNYCEWQSLVVNIQEIESIQPTVTIIYPTASDTVSHNGFRFKGDASDASGIAEVRVYVEDLSRGTYTVNNVKATYNADTGRWRYDVAASHITPGAQVRLWVRAKDGVGNYSEWLTVTNNVQSSEDNIAPSVVITTPKANTQVSRGGFTVSGIVQDPSGIDSVLLWIYDAGRKRYTVRNGRAYVNEKTGVWKYTVARRRITRGKRAEVWVRAKDKAGNKCRWHSRHVKIRR